MKHHWIALFGLAGALAACGAGAPGDDEAAGDEAPGAVAEQPAAGPEASSAGPPPGDEAPAPETMAVAMNEAEASPSGPLYTVQIAAFVDVDTAQGLARRMREMELPVWIASAEVDGRTFNRVRVGAAPSLDQAQALGRWVTERYHWPVWVAPVESFDAVSGDAVATTRTFLQQN